MALKRYESTEQIEAAIDHNRVRALVKAEAHDKAASEGLERARALHGKGDVTRIVDHVKWEQEQAEICRKRARLRLEGKAKRLGCKLSEFKTGLLPAMGEDRSVPVR